MSQQTFILKTISRSYKMPGKPNIVLSDTQILFNSVVNSQLFSTKPSVQKKVFNDYKSKKLINILIN
jgi:hypothetical protein